MNQEILVKILPVIETEFKLVLKVFKNICQIEYEVIFSINDISTNGADAFFLTYEQIMNNEIPNLEKLVNNENEIITDYENTNTMIKKRYYFKLSIFLMINLMKNYN